MSLENQQTALSNQHSAKAKTIPLGRVGTLGKGTPSQTLIHPTKTVLSVIACSGQFKMESSPMLSERMVAVLSALPYRPDAEWGVNILPFGSVYWNDEMPEMRDMLDRLAIKDMGTVLRMFGIRRQLWDNEVLSAADRQLWDAVQRQVPDWALFKRMNLSDEQRAAREKAEQQVQQEFDSLGADDDGTQGSSP